MVDLHSHILFDIDDGPETLYESMQLCRMGVEYGIDRIVATSHLYKPDEIAKYISKRNDRILRLREQIERAEMPLRIYPGAEVFVNDDIFYAHHLEKVTINNSRYILIEFDFHGLSGRRLVHYVDEIFRIGLVPIIAHPERYSYLQRDFGLVEYLVDRGALFQINADSLSGRSGYTEFEMAYRMVRHHAASFIATDAHSHLNRSNDMLRMIQGFPPDISRERLDFMLYDAPLCVLADDDFPPGRGKHHTHHEHG